MASKILPLFSDHTVYVEPFAGGAALLFAKPIKKVLNKDSYKEVINDKDNLISTMYRVAIQQREAFELEIQSTLYSRNAYKKAINICKNHKLFSDLEVAWACYVNCNQSFSSTMYGGWSCSLVKNAAAVWENRKNNLSDILDRLKGVFIESNDAFEVIKKWDSPETLFYCAPPYPGACQGHYAGYTQEDFYQLCDLLDSIKGNFVLSCYENQALSNRDWERFEFDASCSAKKEKSKRINSKRTELVLRKIK